MVEKACPKCKVITEESKCPICGSTKLSTKWSGLLIITSAESEIAKEMGIKPGKYALQVK